MIFVCAHCRLENKTVYALDKQWVCKRCLDRWDKQHADL